MPSIRQFTIEPLKRILKKKGDALARPVNPNLQQSADTISLSGVKTLAELNQMEPPRMGKLERFMSVIRGTNDQVKYAGKVKLRNFSAVDETVYRGAMPESGPEIEKLKNAYNVHTIIDLRGGETTPDKYIDFEREWTKHHGIKYERIEMDSHREPSQEELERFFQLIEDAKRAGGTVYVHCKHGIDRTGSMIAAYEAKLGRSQAGIYERMKQHGYNYLHKRTRPAQRKFVKSADLRARVAAAEAERRKKANILPPVSPTGPSLLEMMGMEES